MAIPSQRIHVVLFTTLLASLPCSTHAAKSVDFQTCLQEIHAGLWGTTGGTTNTGQPISNISLATSITYSLCTTACGSGPTPFSWNTFSQQFGSWLLPWLALLSQLPFGTNNLSQNFLSVLLAVGSPTLAAFSLTVTVLDTRWIVKRFTASDPIRKHSNSYSAMKALSSLHQAPLIITSSPSLLHSLISSQPGSDFEASSQWWSALVQWLDYTHPVTWSLSAVTSIAWVIIAYAFTVIDSLQGDITQGISAHGQGIGSIWLWLLPVVSGWLQLSPNCDSDRLYRAVPHANAQACTTVHATVEDIHNDTGKLESCIQMGEHESESESGSSSPLDATREQAFRLAVAGTVTSDGEYKSLRCDELWTAPIYNYARFLPWAQSVERVACAFEVSARAKLGILSATGSPELGGEEKEKFAEDVEAASFPQRSRWAPDIFSRFCIASILALVLQWGTTGPAMLVNYFTPTYGIGCRTGSYLLYGSIGTLSWALLMLSAFLSHYSTTSTAPQALRSQIPLTPSRPTKPRPTEAASGTTRIITLTRRLSIFLRITGKALAYSNALWILLACIFQFTNFYDRCWCNGSVISLGPSAYNVLEISWDEDVPTMRVYWIVGVAVAAGSAMVYAVFNHFSLRLRLR